MRIILASKSPRRQQLLSVLGIKFDIINSNVDESIIPPSVAPIKYCQELAELKAQTISKQFPEAGVIGADTIVVLNNEIIEKPVDKADAINILQKLSGNTHRVHTGVSFQCEHSAIHYTFYESTEVTFTDLSLQSINFYIDNFLPYDKAGSYGIQDWSATFISNISGCYNNVVGFPLFRFNQLLKELKVEVELIEDLLEHEN